MLSRSTFDLDHFDNSVIKLQIASSSDLRDKVARRFIEKLGGNSQWCEILKNGDSEYIIVPIPHDELRRHGQEMIQMVEDVARKNKAIASLSGSECL